MTRTFFLEYISLQSFTFFSNPKEIARIEKRAQGIGARPFSLVGIIYPTAAVAGLRFDIYKVNSLECLTLWLFFRKKYFQNALNMVPALLGCLCILLKDSECTKCGLIETIFLMYLSLLVAQMFQSQSNSCQFVGATLFGNYYTISSTTFNLK